VKLLLSPHNDDAVLFASFTVLRERPLVATIFDSHVQAARGTGITMARRRAEDQSAMAILGAPVMFLGLSDAEANAAAVESHLRQFFNQPEMVYAPCAESNGHPHHNLVAEVAARVFQRVTYYMTYTPAGKSKGKPVSYDAGWPLLKLRALACYESQIGLANCHEHFLREQSEYYA
jgi:LmbE family N-acetylglucosaminyl deacetylase